MSETDAPVPGLPAPDRDELDAAEFVVREELAEGNLGLVDYSLPIVLAEYDRMRAELTKTIANCGVCKLGGRWLHINDSCPEHGDHWEGLDE